MDLTYDKDQEEAHYHFALGEIVYYISQYGIDYSMLFLPPITVRFVSWNVELVDLFNVGGLICYVYFPGRGDVFGINRLLVF